MEHHFLARSGNRELPVRSQRIAVSTALTLNGGLARTQSNRPVQNGGNLGDAFERIIWNVPALSRLAEEGRQKFRLIATWSSFVYSVSSVVHFQKFS